MYTIMLFVTSVRANLHITLESMPTEAAIVSLMYV